MGRLEKLLVRSRPLHARVLRTVGEPDEPCGDQEYALVVTKSLLPRRDLTLLPDGSEEDGTPYQA